MKNTLLEIGGTALIGIISYCIFVLPFVIALIKHNRKESKEYSSFPVIMFMVSILTLVISIGVTALISNKLFPPKYDMGPGTITWAIIAIGFHIYIMVATSN